MVQALLSRLSDSGATLASAGFAAIPISGPRARGGPSPDAWASRANPGLGWASPAAAGALGNWARRHGSRSSDWRTICRAGVGDRRGAPASLRPGRLWPGSPARRECAQRRGRRSQDAPRVAPGEASPAAPTPPPPTLPSPAVRGGSAGTSAGARAEKGGGSAAEEEELSYTYIHPDPVWTPPSESNSGNGSASGKEEGRQSSRADQGDADEQLSSMLQTVLGRTKESFGAVVDAVSERLRVPPESFILIVSCSVGLLTGASVVAFNDGVHAIRDAVWQGVPSEEGSSWLREQPLSTSGLLLLLVPTAGGVAVGVLNSVRDSLKETSPLLPPAPSPSPWFGAVSSARAVLRPVLKAVAAMVTLGTGNSLGPEGPSVEIGSSIGRGASAVLQGSRERTIALVAAGSAAGIASGFDAAVAGCFFALESVLRRSSSPQQGSPASLTTAMILLSAVLAAVVSQAGLGTDPAVKVPLYEFRSPAELPLYLLLGVLAGGVSVALTRSAAAFEALFRRLHAQGAIIPELSPALGGLLVGTLALAYPEVLYWGFVNVNDILAVRPLQPGPSAALLLQLVAAKILATSFSRGAGLVGGFYAPSLFIGAALGSAYGRLASDVLLALDPDYNITWIQVAAPPAYAMVGMAAVLAGVCQVPLTSVLLLFELTQDYRIILPLMGAVGISSWLASSSVSVTPVPPPTKAPVAAKSGAGAGGTALISPSAAENLPAAASSATSVPVRLQATAPQEALPSAPASMPLPAPSAQSPAVLSAPLGREATEGVVGDAEVPWEVRDGVLLEEQVLSEIPVAAAMRTSFAGVSADATVGEALARMVHHRSWSCLVVGEGGRLLGLLTLSSVQEAVEQQQDRQTQLIRTAQRSPTTGRGPPGSAASTAEELLLTDVAQLPALTICSTVGASPAEPGGGAKKTVLEVTYPDSSLKAAQQRMTARGLRQLPVVLPVPGLGAQGSRPQQLGQSGGGIGAGASQAPIKGAPASASTNGAAASKTAQRRDGWLLVLGLLDVDDIALACRTEVTRRLLALQQQSQQERRHAQEADQMPAPKGTEQVAARDKQHKQRG